jgi:hypothetical protein
MEDCYSTKISEVDGKTVGLFGVFDGRRRMNLYLLSTSISIADIAYTRFKRLFPAVNRLDQLWISRQNSAGR